MLHQHKLEKSAASCEVEEKRSILLSATLLQLLTEKKFQYQDDAVQFEPQFDHSGQFAFIAIEPSAFKRMVSNLINNAVEALSGQSGILHLKVDANTEDENSHAFSVDVVLVDDDKHFASALMNYVFEENKVDYFDDPHRFRENLSRYSKTTRIYLDNSFSTGAVSGLILAQELHEKGFVHLYLLSGESFREGEFQVTLK